MKQFPPFLWLIFAMFSLAAVACNPSPQSAILAATPRPELVETVQAQQYGLMAQGTIQAQQATADFWQSQQAILAQQLEGTAAADNLTRQAQGTRAAADNQATATMQALHLAQAQAQATAAAVGTATAESVQATATGAAVQATATMQALHLAQAQAQATGAAVGTATAAAVQAQATGAAVQATATMQAVQLVQAQSEARRGQAVSYFYTAAVAFVALSLIVGAWLLFPLMKARASMVTYGAAANPLFLHTSGRGRLSILNPLTLLQAGATVDETGQVVQHGGINEQIQILLAGGLQNLMAQQAQFAQQVTKTLTIGGATQSTITTTRAQNQPLRLTATSPAVMPTAEPSPLQPVPLSTIARQIAAGHVMLIGETGAGKTTAAGQLANIRRDSGHDVIIIDPHAAAGAWGGYEVAGRGRDYNAIMATLQRIEGEFGNRYQQRAQRGGHFAPLTLLVDELPAIAENAPAAIDILKTLLMEARKVDIWLIALTQQTNVTALGIRGQSQVLANFRYVVKLGEFAEPELTAGMKWPATIKTSGAVRPLVIDAPHNHPHNHPVTPVTTPITSYNNAPVTGYNHPPVTGYSDNLQWGAGVKITPAHVAHIRQLKARGKSKNEILAATFGGKNTAYLKIINEALEVNHVQA